MQLDDQGLVLDMLIAARQAAKYLSGVSLADYRSNEVLQDAVIHQVQIMGEAASRISEEFRATHGEVQWSEIIGMRHRLVHDYRRVSRDIVWATVRESIPGLIAALEPLVPPPSEEE